MSLKMINLRRLGPRLILSTTLLLILSLSIVSSIIYFLLANSLRKSDMELLRRLSENYAQAYVRNGAQALAKEISPEIMVTITAPDGRDIFSQMPRYIDQDFEDEDEIAQLKREASRLPLRSGVKTVLLLSGEEDNDFFQRMEYQLRLLAWENDWVNILPLIDNDLFEVYVRQLDSGNWIKVGRSSEEREEHLARIRFIAFIVLIPFVFIGVALSFFLARSVLRPIRDLVEKIRHIQSGKLQVRGEIRGTGDEIDVLTSEFNTLLDKNDRLIQNIKSTVDNVAHDLRTPLTRLRTSAEYALTNATSPEDLRESLADALENSEQILDLLNAIMDVTEAETQTMKLKREPIEVAGLIARLVDFFQMVADEKAIQIRIKVESSIFIEGDEVRLLQAFSNILDNALKFSPPERTVEIMAVCHEGYVTLSFRDQGIGIKESDLDKIWERLYRGDGSRSTPGIGIGLSLVKAVIMVHGGKVEVQSRPAQGSNFLVTLPLCNVPERIS